MRKSFAVIIENKEYDVYSIDGKEHEGYNDTPKTWWLYYADRLPEGLFPSIDSDSWKPFSAGINRCLWDIKINQSNTTKEKWNETQFRNHTSVEMWCNGKHIYSFGTTGDRIGLNFAMSKIGYLQVALSEHPYNFFDQQSENGRKIWWRGLPATVRPSSYPGEISIIPDYTTGLDEEQWWGELHNRERNLGEVKTDGLDNDFEGIEEENFNEDKQRGYINWGDALSDQHINWFRS